MRSAFAFVFALTIAFTSLCMQACKKSDSSSKSNAVSSSATSAAFGGVYTSVEGNELTFDFKSGGVVVMTAKDFGTSNGTYTIDQEKIVVNIDNQTRTFIRDGNCIEDQQGFYGKLCKGGKSGEASNVTTRDVPTTPSGTYIAKNADGEFKIEFKPGNKFTLSIVPVRGKAEIQEATFIIEGDTIHATLPQSVPMVLKFVNNAYESTSFGLPMKFVKQ